MVRRLPATLPLRQLAVISKPLVFVAVPAKHWFCLTTTTADPGPRALADAEITSLDIQFPDEDDIG